MQLPENAIAIIGAYLSLMAILAVTVETITNWLKLPSRSPLQGKASLEDILEDAKGWAVVGGVEADPETWRQRIETLNQALKTIGESPLSGEVSVYDVIEKLSKTTSKHIQSERNRRALIRIVSIALGFLLAWLFGLNTLTMLGPILPEVNGQSFLQAVSQSLGDEGIKYLGFVLSGFAASAGSSFWHDQSARLRNLKKVAGIAREAIPTIGRVATQLPPQAPETPGSVSVPPTNILPTPRVESHMPEVSPADRLADLARQSVEYVQQLKQDRKLTVPEPYIAASWVLTEATEEDLPVTIDQINSAVRAAFGQSG